MNNKLNLLEEEALKTQEFDPIAEAEKKLGRNPAAEALSLALLIENSQASRDLAGVLGDTQLSCSYDEFLAVAYRLGFEKVYTEAFTSEDKDNEVFEVFWHRDGMLLTGESYTGKRLNTSSLYYNWSPTDPTSRRPSQQNGGYVRDPNTREIDWSRPVFVGSYDGRQFLALHIKQLRQQGKLLAKWIEAPFVWLLNYSEPKNPRYDYKAINDLKVRSFPLHVRALTGL